MQQRVCPSPLKYSVLGAGHKIGGIGAPRARPPGRRLNGDPARENSQPERQYVPSVGNKLPSRDRYHAEKGQNYVAVKPGGETAPIK
jgi:hypothetical protein